MAKYLTYKELMALALEHYEEGGDMTYECIDERTFNESYNKLTKADALKMFALDKSIRNDICGY